MKKIDIRSKKFPNTFALVDDCDYEELNKHKWYALEIDSRLYAVRNILVNGKRKKLYMHTAILGSIEGKEIDHRIGIGLDNQRINLRHCTHLENMKNRRVTVNNTSGYKGVVWNKRAKKWHARVTSCGKVLHLGYFTCLIRAAKRYDEAAIEYHGEFAKLNFERR